MRWRSVLLLAAALVTLFALVNAGADTSRIVAASLRALAHLLAVAG